MDLKDGPTRPNGRPDTKPNTETLNIWIANPYTLQRQVAFFTYFPNDL